MNANRWDVDWLPIYFVCLLLCAFLLVIAAVGEADRSDVGGPAIPGRPPTSLSPSLPSAVPQESPQGSPQESPPSTALPNASDLAPGRALPGGISRIFADNRMLVAYYGTAGTGSLGVLGEGTPDQIMPRLARAARAFTATGRPVQPVFELIVTVAHAGPTQSGQYSSDIDRAGVQSYLDAARRHGVLVVLDLQPGTADFLTVAKRWEWALKDPLVGLALDPEWRMSRGGIPGQRIGSVSAREINRVSRWLQDLVVAEGLPEKLFVLHQFRTDMIRGIDEVRPRANLAMVQHVDGFGSPREKVATLTAVAKPKQFNLGLKLFYDEDIPRMKPAAVLRLRPTISFVSFQ